MALDLPERHMMNADNQFLQLYLGGALPWLYVSTYWWTAVGFAGNLLFGSRFLLQWLASEKRRELVVPDYFWHLSFWGSLINLVYALHLDSAPLIFGVAALPLIYGRNLVLLYRTRGTAAEPRPVRSELPDGTLPAHNPAI
jgi:lipid-A-disaccharide synthase-like uncharacterized protein